MIWFALEELAAAGLTDELPVTDCNLAAEGDHARAAFDRQALEGIVIHVHGLGLDRERAAIGWVKDDQVSVAAGLNSAFAREKAEQLRRLRAGDLDEAVQVEPAAVDTIGVEALHAVFQRGH